jgi:predicted  nucleic acid-binding Zn-ribbon protein
MKQFTTTPIMAWAALALAASQFLVSTQLTAAGYKKADKTGASIAEFRDEIVNIRKEVEATVVALDNILETANIDPRKAFKEFDKAVPRVENAAQKAKKRSEDMKAKGKAYFDQWEKELATLNDPEIRQLAQQRKLKLQGAFDALRSVMEPARDQFNTWLSSLRDVRNYLSNDLTINGIDAAKDLITKTKSSGREVQQTLDVVIAELNTIAATLTPATAK